jgi:asparagine synthase (glutamine-hydrolysing)
VARPGRRARRLAAGILPPGARGQGWLEMLGAGPIERYFHMVTFQRAATLGSLLTREVRARAGLVSSEPFEALAREAGAPDYVSTLQYIDVRSYLPEDILTKVDRTSMLVSLEARVPLLDHRLMEFLATMPSRLKLHRGAGKVILKRLLAADLPAEIVRRPKMGFGVPLAGWLRRELAPWSREVLLGRPCRERGWLEPRAVARLVDDHCGGGRDRSAQIWALLCLENWARRWLDAR